MKAIFKPEVYTTQTNGVDGNGYTWDLLTLDGDNPKDTIYFMRKGDCPSSDQFDNINNAIDNEEHEKKHIDIADIVDFDISMEDLRSCGEYYSDIVKQVSNIIDKK